ncbi:MULTISPECIES: hypothetical protein [unclassified Streptomyces]|uniref:hypothetical protein n=1 Tax=unclassified Streptomyces TaxID=2593676 RepID=UPI002F918FC3
MLTSDAYGTLAKVLGALRAHDTETIEHLADPRIRSGSWLPEGAMPGKGIYAHPASTSNTWKEVP